MPEGSSRKFGERRRLGSRKYEHIGVKLKVNLPCSLATLVGKVKHYSQVQGASYLERLEKNMREEDSKVKETPRKGEKTR